MEIWEDIAGYVGLYQVSNLGNVKSLKTNKNLYYSKSGRNKKYLRVGLYKNEKRTMFSVHKLVAEAFIPNPNNLPQVNHKDENPSNNCVSNLEWCTVRENINYGNRHLRKYMTTILNTLMEKYPEKNDIIQLATTLNDKIKTLKL